MTNLPNFLYKSHLSKIHISLMDLLKWEMEMSHLYNNAVG